MRYIKNFVENLWIKNISRWLLGTGGLFYAEVWPLVGCPLYSGERDFTHRQQYLDSVGCERKSGSKNEKWGSRDKDMSGGCSNGTGWGMVVI